MKTQKHTLLSILARLGIVPLLLITALSVMPAPVGQAVAINVDTSDSDGSLRETIQKTITNAADGMDIVNDPMAPAATYVVDRFDDTAGATACTATLNDCSLRGAIIAANGNPDADAITLPAGTYTLTITGAGEDACATGDLDITEDLTINGAGAGSTIINGDGIDRVLHILLGPTVVISDVTITNGNTGGVGGGGGILNRGTLTLANSVVSGNSSPSGGGILNYEPTAPAALTLNHSTVSGNSAAQGGGILNRGMLTLANSVVPDNSATTSGGGIQNEEGGTMQVTNSTISGNDADVAGGGIMNLGTGSTAVMTLTNSTVSDNDSPTGRGSGIENYVGSGGGTATCNLQNSILASNTGGGQDCRNLRGTLTSLGYNLDGDGTCNLIQSTDLPNTTDPRLGPLADNGGDTCTHELLSGSPAIDHIPVGSCIVSTDQRDFPRPAGNGCDIGAYEKVFDLTKSAAPTTAVNPGQTITYTLMYTNTVYSLATAIVITDEVPISVTNVAYTYSGATITPTGGITYAWEVEDLPLNARVIITITGEISPALPGGVFTNTATVVVSGTIMGFATAPITVNYAPAADAGVNQSVSLSTLVTLDGSGSDDPVDHHLPLTYGWTQTGGTPVILSSATVSQPTFTAPGAAAVLTFTLTVTDSLGRPDLTPDEVVIFVHDIPVAGLSAANSSTTTLGCPTHFTATITAGSSVEYEWAFGDGLTSTGAMAGPYTNIADHIYDHTLICGKRVATYTAVVTATNTPTTTTYILTDTTSVTITNDPPVADAGLHQQVIVDELVTLDGSGSYDPDYPCNDIVEYGWVQTGGPTATLSSNTAVAPTFIAPGAAAILTFTLTVTDTGCLTATDTVTVTVIPSVGGYTEPASPSALLWPWWVALAAAIGVTAAVVGAMLGKHGERKMPSQ